MITHSFRPLGHMAVCTDDPPTTKVETATRLMIDDHIHIQKFSSRADFGGLNNAKLVQSVITWTAAAEEGRPADVGQLELLVGEVE